MRKYLEMDIKSREFAINCIIGYNSPLIAVN